MSPISVNIPQTSAVPPHDRYPEIAVQTAWLVLLAKYTDLDTLTLDIIKKDQVLSPVHVSLCKERALDELTNELRSIRGRALIYQSAALKSLLPNSGVYENANMYRFALCEDHNGDDLLQSTFLQDLDSSRSLDICYDIDPSRSQILIRHAGNKNQQDAWLQHWTAQMSHILHQIWSSTGEATISDLNFMSPEDISTLKCWNGHMPAVEDTCLHTTVSQQARDFPQDLAVDAWDGQLTYKSLEELSSQLAAHLISNGVESGVSVPLLFDHSVWTTVAILAVLKAGGAFVPLDSAYPAARIESVVSQVNASIALASPKYTARVQPFVANVIAVDAGLSSSSSLAPTIPLRSTPSDPAYIIFTSGSTGTPKGVVIEHRGVSTSLAITGKFLGVHQKSRVLQRASYAFDLSIMETFLALLVGGCLCVPSERERIDAVGDILKKMRITFCVLTPSHARTVDPSEMATLENMTLGGEAIGNQDIQACVGSLERLNGAYGPTEASIVSAAIRFRGHEVAANNIGKGMGCVNHVVDRHDHTKLVPIGVPGELLIEGPIVGRGYLHDAEKTAAAFVDTPPWLANMFPDRKERLYRTGDLVRYEADGSLLFLGRLDTQVKLRGQRIELGEIEDHLYRSVGKSMDLVVEIATPLDGKPTLIASFCPKHTHEVMENAATFRLPYSTDSAMQKLSASLKVALAKALPNYMIPEIWLTLNRLPLTISGKCDRKELRRLVSLHTTAEISLPSESDKIVSPTSQEEKQLSLLWSQVLGIPQDCIGKESNFFQLGGDSLSAIMIVKELRKSSLSLSVEDIFKKPTLADLALVMRSAIVAPIGAIPPFSLIDDDLIVDHLISDTARQCSIAMDEIEDIYPCTPMQEALLASAFSIPGVYVVHATSDLHPSVNLGRLRAAWQTVAARESILRTRLINTSKHALQVVVKQSLPWSVQPSLSPSAFIDSEDKNLMAPGKPLATCAIVSRPSTKGLVLIFRAHHAVCDAWSLKRIFTSVEHAYHGQMPVPSLEFKYFTKQLLSLDRHAHAMFWTEYLDQASCPSLPFIEKSNHVVRTNSLCCQEIQSPKRLKSNITTATIIRAAWALLVSKYSGSDDVVFGTTSNGRALPMTGIEDIGGPTIATVPTRVRFDPKQTVGVFLQNVQHQSASVIVFEQYGVRNIKELGPGVAAACGFQNLLVVQVDEQDSEPDMTEKVMGQISAFNDLELPLVVQVEMKGEKSRLKASFDSRVVEEVQVLRILQQYEHILQQLCTHSLENSLEALNYLCPADKDQIEAWSSGQYEHQETCIHTLFASQAKDRPNDTAVNSWDGQLTYRELDDYASRLAHILTSRGVRPGTIVPFCFYKSMWAVVSALAILKAGGAFVGLDPSHPAERLMEIISQTNANLILSHSSTGSLRDGVVQDIIVVNGDLFRPHEAPCEPAHVLPSDVAFVQFTSGSTGVPKGIVMTHRAFCSSIRTHAPVLGLNSKSRVLQFSAYTYDVSVAEIFTTLAVGGCVCVPSDVERTNDLARAMQRMKVNWAFQTPSMAAFITPETVPCLRTLVLGGEAATVENISTWAPRVNLVNSYGPAECGIWTNAVTNMTPGAPGKNLGRGIGCGLWLCDPSDVDRLMPVGTVGEIVVESASLATGYLNDPEKTARAFIEAPAWAQADNTSGLRRFYRSGDLARYTSDGSIWFMGRTDSQIKLRGQRIELAEIELQLSSALPQDSSSVVEMIRPSNGTAQPLLIAFISVGRLSERSEKTAINLSLDKSLQAMVPAITDKLSSKLPRHMIPTAWLFLEQMPFNGNGKIDRKRLNVWASEFSVHVLSKYGSLPVIYQPPTTPTEIGMQKCWSKVLKLERSSIGLKDNFFRLGGDSITAMRLVALSRENGVDISVDKIFKYPMLDELSSAASGVESEATEEDILPFSLLPDHSLVDRIRQEAAEECGVLLEDIEDVYPCTPLQEGFMALSIKQKGAYVAQLTYRIPESVDLRQLEMAWRSLHAQHHILRTRIIQTSAGSMQAVVKSNISWTVLVDEQIRPTEYLTQDASNGMEYGQPLSRLSLLQNSDETSACLVWTISHAIYDGITLPLLFENMEKHYLGRTPLSTAQFHHFIKHNLSVDGEMAKVFWASQLQNASATEFCKATTPHHAPTSRQELKKSIIFSKENNPGVTKAIIVRAAWALLLGHYSNSRDVVFGMTSSGRGATASKIHEIDGPTLATVPMRMKHEEHDLVIDYLGKAQQQFTQMTEYEQYGLQKIRECCGEAKTALDFQTFLIIHGEPSGRFMQSRIGLEYSPGSQTDFYSYPLNIDVFMQDSGADVEIHFDINVIVPGQVNRLVNQLEYVIQQLSRAESEKKIQDIEYASAMDLIELHEWNSEVGPPSNETLHGLVDKSARRNPSGQAIASSAGPMNYEDLIRYSDKLAQHLCTLGIVKGDMIPLYYEKSPFAIVSMLAILKTGASFAPVSPTNPKQRSEVIFREIHAKLAVTSPVNTEACSVLNDGTRTVSVSRSMLESLPDLSGSLPIVSAEDVALIMFTSGSTGKPKGVVQNHAGLCTTVLGQGQALGFSEHTRAFQFAAYSFDASIGDIFCTFSQGGVLCIPTEEERVDDLAGVIDRLKATQMCITPSVARSLSPADVPSLRTLILGGEAASSDDYQTWGGKLRLINVYGPTECAIWAAAAEPNFKTALAPSALNLGKAMIPSMCSFWIVSTDDHNKLAATGVAGELVIGGPIVSMGYLHDKIKTDKAFFQWPKWLKSDTRLYKTGDLARFNDDGTLEYISRRDTQIKLRGLRVELGDIEHHIRQFFDGAREIAVDLLKPESTGSEILAAYITVAKNMSTGTGLIATSVTARDQLRASTAALAAHLKSVLPSYMVPAIYVPVNKLPLSAAGKLDRNAVRDQAIKISTEGIASFRETQNDEVIPRFQLSDAEGRLWKLWQSTLNNISMEATPNANFFDLGGDSVVAMRLVSSGRKAGLALSVNDIFKNPTLRHMASCMMSFEIEKVATKIAPFALVKGISTFDLRKEVAKQCSVRPRDIEDVYPGSPLQDGLMTLSAREAGSYTACLVYKIPKSVDVDQFCMAWDDVAEHNPTLRTRFVYPPGAIQTEHRHSGFFQAVVRKPIEWEILDDVTCDEYVARGQTDLTIGNPLVKFAIINNVEDDSAHFIWSLHHSIYDGVVLDRVMKNLEEAYHSKPLTPVSNFNQFISYVQKAISEKGRSFWRQELKGAEPPAFPELPRSAYKPSPAATIDHIIPIDKPRGTMSQITLATLLRGAWAILVGHYSQSTDIVFGVTVNGRNAPLHDIETISGPSIATIPFRARFDQEETVLYFLQRLQLHSVELIEYEQIGMQNIRNVSGDAAGACDIRSLLLIQNMDAESKLPLELEKVNEFTQNMKDFAINLECTIVETRVEVMANFDEKIVDVKQMSRIIRQFEHIFHQLSASGNSKLGDVEIISHSDLAEIGTWNRLPPPELEMTINELFESTVAEHPKSTAIHAWDGVLTYAQLDRISSKFAAELRQQGVELGSLVPFYFEKSKYAIVAILAILKAGGACVPLSPSDPSARIAEKIQELNSRVLLCSAKYSAQCHSFDQKIVVVSSASADVLPDSECGSSWGVSTSTAAFVMYTSGSTGTPKGIIQEHGGVCGSVKAQARAIKMTSKSRTLQFAAYTFDVSIGDIFGTFSQGGCVCVISDEDRWDNLAAAIRLYAADNACLTPSVARTIAGAVPHLKTLVIGGEAPTTEDIEIWAEKVCLINIWGVTEGTVWAAATMDRMNKYDDPANFGQTMGAVRLWIVDSKDHDKLAPIGCSGEIVIEGPIVAKGYLNDQARSQSVFLESTKWLESIPNILATRLYKTGDLAKYTSDGSLIFLGRKDNQVKLRGQRIEVGEIEHQLRRFLSRDWFLAVDVISPENDPQSQSLMAFISQSSTTNLQLVSVGTISGSMMSSILSAQAQIKDVLPPFMVPTTFIPITKMPLSTSGKLRRKELRTLASKLSSSEIKRLSSASTSGIVRAPRTEHEKKISKIWSNVLKGELFDMSLDDNFFRVGGDSIKAIRLVSVARDVGINLSVQQIFDNPKMVDMATVTSIGGHGDFEDAEIQPFSLIGDEKSVLLTEVSSQCLVQENQIVDIFPCTALQEGLMALSLKAPRSYSAQLVFRIPPQLDVLRFKSAWRRTVMNNFCLSTRIIQTSVGLRQAIVDPLSPRITEHTSVLEDYLEQDKMNYFGSGTPLARFALVEEPGKKFWFVLSIHHSVYDGMLLPQIFEDLQLAYHNNSLQKTVLFRNFIAHIKSISHESSTNFWTKQLKDATPSVFPEYPVANYEPSTNSYLKREIKLSRIAGSGITTASIIRACWCLILTQHSNSEDVVFGVTTNGRSAPVRGIENINGPTIATMPVRFDISKDENMSAKEFLNAIQAQASEMIPFEQTGLQNIRKMCPDAADSCDLRTLLVIQGQETGLHQLPLGLTQHTSEADEHGQAINLQCVIYPHHIHVEANFDNRCVNAVQMSRLLAQLDHVLQQLVQEKPDCRLADVEIISPSDVLEIREWNKTMPPIVDECMHVLIQNQVAARSHADAVVSWDGRYTYTELDDVTSRLAHHLVSLGVGPEVVVPLFFEKSAYTVVSMLAIQKAGGAFVSLDLTAPGARLDTLIEATGAKLVLSCKSQAHKIEGKIPILLIVDGALVNSLPQSHQSPVTGVTPDNAAYLLFTSGSTGTPKGIIVNHRAGSTSAIEHGRVECVLPESRVFQYASYTFDVSVSEIFTTLIHGGCICIPSESQRLNDIAGAMNMLEVNHAFLTPTVGSLLKPDDVPNLKVLKLGGEALTRENVALWASRVTLSNSYGVAECAIRSAFKNYLKPEDNFANLGKAVGCALWIANPADHSKLSPIGSIGELLIEGPTLARGYLADPAKTESSFIKAPKWLKSAFPGRSERIYKTGDLVRYCHDGSLEFVGRSDTQVKLRGQRIDLREIEHFLNATPHVRLASVLIPTSGEFVGNLVAVVSLNAYLEENNITNLNSIQLLPSDWRHITAKSFAKCEDFLAEKLPPYMLPNAWIAVESIPILQSGKMNRKKLLNWVEDMEKDVAHGVKMIRANEGEDAIPMVQRELEIRSIFGRVLNIPEVSMGPKTSFFRLGGDSISAMQVVTLCRAKGIHLTMQDIMIHKTIARLAASTTDDSQSSLDLSSLTEEYGVPHQLSPIQNMFFDLMPDGNNLYDQSFYLKLKSNLPPERIEDAIYMITQRHSMLRAVFSKSGDGSWVQTIRSPEKKVHSFESYEISRPQDALHVIDKSRKLVDFEKGLVFAAALITAPERQTLFVTCHHLVVDLVSWRTIFRDLEDYLSLGHLLPLYSIPFTVWSDLQIEQAKVVEPESIVPNTRPNMDGNFWGMNDIVNTTGDNIQESFYLDADATAVLLQQNDQGTLVEPIDVFIGSLMHAFRETFEERNTPTVFFEGHGREPWDKAIDVTNTVGWFTSLCPISIEDGDAASPFKAIQGTRDLRSSIKDNGRAFWASKFHNQKGQEIFGRNSKIEISFNYTGLYQQLERDDAMFEVVDEGEYETDDPTIVRFAFFDVAVLINNGRMRVLFTWNKEMQHQQKIREWMEAYKRTLENLVATVNSSWRGSTVGDIVNLSLSQNQIQHLVESVRPSESLPTSSHIDHIAPCAAIQQYMLSTETAQPGLVNSQFLFQISLPEHEKKLDFVRFTRAWQKTVNRHSILSTHFIKPDAEKEDYVQIVMKASTVKIRLIQGVSEPALDRTVVPYKYGDLHCSFTVFETTDSRYFGKIDVSHCLIDEGSRQIIYNDLSRAYANSLDAAPALPYTKAISERSTVAEDSIRFWKEYTKNVTRCYLPTTPSLQTSTSDMDTIVVDLPEISQLRSFCTLADVSLTSFFQTAWSIILSVYTNQDSTAFIYISSGRETQVESIESVVGPMFIQLISAAKLDQNSTVIELIELQQQDNTRTLPYQNITLCELKDENGESPVDLANSYFNYVRRQPTVQPLTQDLSFETISATGSMQHALGFEINDISRNTLEATLSYRPSKLSGKHMKGIASITSQILSAMVASGDITLGSLRQRFLAQT